MSDETEGRKEASKTYIEQTKLLVTLASAFVVAPAGLLPFFKDGDVALSGYVMVYFLWAEALFVGSILFGYFVLGTIAGYQYQGKYDIYRTATLYSSRIQILSYLAGLGCFVAFVKAILRQLAEGSVG